MYDKQLTEALGRAFLVPHNVATDYSSPAYVTQYVPELGTGGAASTAVFTSTTDITYTVDGTTPAGADDVGASGVVATATYTTMGAMQDAVNSSRAFRMYLGAALRADLSDSTIKAQAAASCIGANGLSFYLDRTLQFESGKYAHGFVISGEKFINNKNRGWLKDWDAQCVNVLDYMGAEVSTGTGGFLKLYQGQQGQTEELIWQYALVDATLKEINASLSKEIGLMTAPGKRLIVRLEGDANTALTRLDGNGRTAVMDGSFAVTEKNYTTV